MWWQAPIIPAAWGTEAGESLELGRRRLQRTEITALKLGQQSRTPSQLKKKKAHTQQIKLGGAKAAETTSVL